MNQLTLETIQHSKLPDINSVEPISDKDYQVLEEVKSVLVKHNYTNRFGLVLLHKHFDIAEDEILMETTDEYERISTVKAVKSTGNESDTIETMWKFKPDIDAVTVCVLKCQYFLGHKRVHVKVGK